MLAGYKKKANIGAAVWLASMIGTIATMPLAGGQNVWEASNPIPAIMMAVMTVAYFYAFWAYAKAKGYSGVVGVIAPVFAVIGLVVLALLKDKHPEEPKQA